MTFNNGSLGLRFLKAIDTDGRLVNFVADVDFSGTCQTPRILPLRRRVLWHTAKYVDLYNHLPGVSEEIVLSRSVKRNGVPTGEGTLADAVIESVKIRCQSCQDCANVRKRRWARAVEGFLAGADLSIFYTLTFSDEYFEFRRKKALEENVAEYKGNLGHLRGYEAFIARKRAEIEDELQHAIGYDAANASHDAEGRAMMCGDRQKMFKRLRKHLPDACFQGANLIGQMSVYEYGDTRGRLHLHGLMHFTLPSGASREEVFNELKSFIVDDWVQRGVGAHWAQDVQLYEPGTSSKTAAYCLNYLLKYETTAEGKRVTASRARLACSKGYRKLGTIAYFAAYPRLVPDGMLREVTPREVDDISMKAASKREDWRYGDDLIMSVASQPGWAKLTPEQRDLALALARAAMIANDGELSSVSGEFLQEDHERDFPPDARELGEWIQHQLREGGGNYGRDLITEDGASVADFRRGEPLPPFDPPPDAWPSGRVMGTNSPKLANNVPDLARYQADAPGVGDTGEDPAQYTPVPASPSQLVPWGDGYIDELTGEFFDADPVTGEPVLPIARRALMARGVGPDTLRAPDGTYRRKPDDV